MRNPYTPTPSILWGEVLIWSDWAPQLAKSCIDASDYQVVARLDYVFPQNKQVELTFPPRLRLDIE